MNTVRYLAELPDSLDWSTALQDAYRVTGCPVSVSQQKKAEVHVRIKEMPLIPSALQLQVNIDRLRKLFCDLTFRHEPKPLDPIPGYERVIAEVPHDQKVGLVEMDMNMEFMNTNRFAVHKRVEKSGMLDVDIQPTTTESAVRAKIAALGIMLTPMAQFGQKIRQKMRALPMADTPITIDTSGDIIIA